MDICITGMGIVSAIGSDVQENFDSLRNEKSGIRPSELHNLRKPVLTGEARLSNAQIIEQYGLEGLYSRTSLLGILAANEAWGTNTHRNDLKTGLISSTSVGGMDRSEVFYRKKLEENIFDPSMLVTHSSGNTTEKIADFLGITGYVNTLSTACSSGANAIMLGARMLKAGILDRVLVGGTDCITHFTVNGFDSLMIYDADWCRPFDESRAGLNLGEGAAYLLLENEKSREITGNKVLAKVSGWANAADAYHQTASSPDGYGATQAISQALAVSGLNKEDISYINAHGTATPNNDLSESIAIKNVFGDKVPPFSSTKAFTGHTLAAAGALEAVFSVLALQNDFIPPNLNYKNPIEETGLVPETKYMDGAGIHHILSNSFGFGGNNTTLIFSKA